MALTWPVKDPDERLDYVIDWSKRLGSDTIITSTWILPSGINTDLNTFTNKATTIWLTGGTVGQTYAITNRITTAGTRIMDQTVNLTIRVK